MNKVILIGNVGSEPDIKTLESGTTVGNFSLATSESYANKQGEKVQQTEWHKIILLGKMAEIAEKYVSKGMKLAIEGKVKTRSYENKEGVKIYVTEIFTDRMEMLSRSEPVQEVGKSIEPEEDDSGDLPF